MYLYCISICRNSPSGYCKHVQHGKLFYPMRETQPASHDSAGQNPAGENQPAMTPLARIQLARISHKRSQLIRKPFMHLFLMDSKARDTFKLRRELLERSNKPFSGLHSRSGFQRKRKLNLSSRSSDARSYDRRNDQVCDYVAGIGLQGWR
jgi:hypothetical protein